MTNTTTALQALEKAMNLLSLATYTDHVQDRIKMAMEKINQARAALAAPAPALDAHSDEALESVRDLADTLLSGAANAGQVRCAAVMLQNFYLAARASQPAPALDARAALVEDCTVYVLNSRGTNRWWASVQGGHNDQGQRIEDEECRQVAQALAARASQPTPAQDAAATVPADRLPLLQRAGFAGLLMEIRGSGALAAHGDEDLIDRVDMAIADFEATPPAPQVAPTAAPELLDALKTCHDALVRIREAGGASTSAEIVAERLIASAAPTAAQPVPELRERLGAAHDASLDDDHRECRAILMEIIRLLDAAPTTPQAPALVPLTDHHKLDNDQQVFFYEQDFYVLSNFSAFNLEWKGRTFPTSEHAYHYEKFVDNDDAWNSRGSIAEQVHRAPSAHEAFKLAEASKCRRRQDWDDVKVGIMRDILREKVRQHEYVRHKLLATGDRELIEDSWRDDYWGWGPNRDGQNMLGKLWMEVRAELRGITPAGTTPKERRA